ncbi:MFS transporter [Streptomyces cupreus]|uniref:MFS transporter n=1 Tax=Streptomyces cupreus TaxID=2759956 RepID=A0A7X1J118_9ACTN|nr:MFS transporter [Streptomyces cupreus]MBC2901595.1 MFS transporter [Streptomyces cupreus]
MSEPRGSGTGAGVQSGEPAPPVWAPLAHPVFRALWTAQLASAIGTWMQTVAAQWLMVQRGPALVALVQTASMLPVFVLGLPSGVLADLVDRRRLLMAAQVVMLVTAGGLAGLTWAGLATPAVLLGLVFLLGCGTALMGPAWQAIQPELVPRDQLLQAASLGAANVNIARSVGPALGGLLVAVAGPAWVFALNAVSFIGVLAVLARWRRPAQVPVGGERERALAALRAGGRYVRNDPEARRVLLRVLLFVPPSAALWALLPVAADRTLGMGAGGYGLLLAAVGVGAVSGAAVLPRVSRRWGSTLLVGVGSATLAPVLVVMAVVDVPALLAALLVVAGLAELAVLSTFNASLQLLMPAWVRARGLAISMTVFMGGAAFGAAFWGALASRIGLTETLLIAAGVLLIGAATVGVWPLSEAAELDRSASMHWPVPSLVFEPAPDRGPVLISIEYRVPTENTAAFVQTMQELALARRRIGGIDWGLYQDADDQQRFLENYLVASWSEHMAQHGGRLTGADRDLEERAWALLEEPPVVTHAFTSSGRRRR